MVLVLEAKNLEEKSKKSKIVMEGNAHLELSWEAAGDDKSVLISHWPRLLLAAFVLRLETVPPSDPLSSPTRFLPDYDARGPVPQGLCFRLRRRQLPDRQPVLHRPHVHD